MSTSSTLSQQTSKPEKKVLVVDDSKAMRQFMRARLASSPDYNLIPHEADSVLNGLYEIREHRPDLVIVDLNITAYNDGLTLLKTANKLHGRTRRAIIVSSDEPMIRALVNRRDPSADAYLIKPVSASDLHNAIRTIFSRP